MTYRKIYVLNLWSVTYTVKVFGCDRIAYGDKIPATVQSVWLARHKFTTAQWRTVGQYQIKDLCHIHPKALIGTNFAQYAIAFAGGVVLQFLRCHGRCVKLPTRCSGIPFPYRGDFGFITQYCCHGQ